MKIMRLSGKSGGGTKNIEMPHGFVAQRIHHRGICKNSIWRRIFRKRNLIDPVIWFGEIWFDLMDKTIGEIRNIN